MLEIKTNEAEAAAKIIVVGKRLQKVLDAELFQKLEKRQQKRVLKR